MPVLGMVCCPCTCPWCILSTTCIFPLSLLVGAAAAPGLAAGGHWLASWLKFVMRRACCAATKHPAPASAMAEQPAIPGPRQLQVSEPRPALPEPEPEQVRPLSRISWLSAWVGCADDAQPAFALLFSNIPCSTSPSMCRSRSRSPRSRSRSPARSDRSRSRSRSPARSRSR